MHEAELTGDQQALVAALRKTLAPFGDRYWRECDQSGGFPDGFAQAMAEGGWLGITLPEAYGGSALGVAEAALVMLEVARCGAMSAASAIHMNIFGPQALVKFGTQAQCAAWLPDLISGASRMCFAVTEPESGLDTTRLATRARRQGDGYVLRGRKIWTSTAQVANKIMIIARTAEYDPDRPAAGLSLFYTDLDRSRIEVRAIPKMGRAAVDSNMLYIDDLPVPRAHLIGEEGEGFRYLLASLNPERILVAAEAVGIGLDALRRASSYAGDRVVFDRPIGQNQAIQLPLAEGWARLEAARLLTLRAAALCDAGRSCGVEANAAKFLAAETAQEVCRQAMATLGGMGYAQEYHVERLYREVMIPYLAPVSQQLALCHIAEKALRLPKSY